MNDNIKMDLMEMGCGWNYEKSGLRAENYVVLSGAERVNPVNT
jgi:hypothetical protein